jgi:class 3 adenylate cyclase/predicted ATPase
MPGEIMAEIETGIFTFLFTDIEGSTHLWEHHPDAMRDGLRRHNAIIRDAIESNNGRVFKTVGDEFCTVFDDPCDAFTAALSSQRTLHAEPWPEDIGELKVRMALHTGPADVEYRDYFGPTLNRIARLESAAHGGQVLLSEVISDLIRNFLPQDVTLLDLGSHRLRDLTDPEHIFQPLVGDLPTDFPPPRTLEKRLHNLPAQTTPFIGRSPEVEELINIVANSDNRLVTIVGPGGMGKTRLALEVAKRQLDARTGGNGRPLFPDGIFFIALSGVESVEDVLPAVAEAVAFKLAEKDPANRSIERQVLDYLRRKRLLLILDNYEQLLPDIEMLSSVLETAPHVNLLVTSREPLSLHGEKRYQIGGMRYPTDSTSRSEPQTWLDDYSSIALFVECIQRIQPDYRFQRDDMVTIGRICQLVGGMPLALELAAGWLDVLSLEEVAEEIAKDLDFLATEIHDMPDRHRSVRAVFESTWNLLDHSDRSIFSSLAIFHGAFSRSAAEFVGQASIINLSALVKRSLIEYDPKTRRYRLHRLLKEFCLEMLAENPAYEDEVRDRHAKYYLEQVALLWEQTCMGKRYEALNNLDLDDINPLAAWQWALQRRDIFAMKNAVLGLVVIYLQFRSLYYRRFEIIDPTINLIKESTNEEELRLLVLALSLAGRFKEGLALLNRPELANVDLRAEEAFLKFGGVDELPVGEQIQYLVDSRSLFKELGDLYLEARTNLSLGWNYNVVGHHDNAYQCFQDCLSYSELSGDQNTLGQALRGLGWLNQILGNYDLAENQLRRALAIFKRWEDWIQAIFSNQNVSDGYIFSGRYEEALAISEEAHQWALDKGFSHYIVLDTAFYRCLCGQFEEAQALKPTILEFEPDGWEYAAFQGFVLGLLAFVLKDYEDALGHLRESVKLYVDNESNWHIATYTPILAVAEAKDGNIQGAIKANICVLKAITGDSPFSKEWALSGVIQLNICIGRVEFALMLHELAWTQPLVANNRMFDRITSELEFAAQDLPLDVVKSARKQGREMEIDATIDKVLAELQEWQEDETLINK